MTHCEGILPRCSRSHGSHSNVVGWDGTCASHMFRAVLPAVGDQQPGAEPVSADVMTEYMMYAGRQRLRIKGEAKEEETLRVRWQPN